MNTFYTYLARTASSCLLYLVEVVPQLSQQKFLITMVTEHNTTHFIQDRDLDIWYQMLINNISINWFTTLRAELNYGNNAQQVSLF